MYGAIDYRKGSMPHGKMATENGNLHENANKSP